MKRRRLAVLVGIALSAVALFALYWRTASQPRFRPVAISEPPFSTAISCLQFTGDGSMMACASDHGHVKLYRSQESFSPVAEFDCGPSSIGSLHFDSNAHSLVVVPSGDIYTYNTSGDITSVHRDPAWQPSFFVISLDTLAMKFVATGTSFSALSFGGGPNTLITAHPGEVVNAWHLPADHPTEVHGKLPCDVYCLAQSSEASFVGLGADSNIYVCMLDGNDLRIVDRINLIEPVKGTNLLLSTGLPNRPCVTVGVDSVVVVTDATTHDQFVISLGDKRARSLFVFNADAIFIVSTVTGHIFPQTMTVDRYDLFRGELTELYRGHDNGFASALDGVGRRLILGTRTGELEQIKLK